MNMILPTDDNLFNYEDQFRIRQREMTRTSESNKEMNLRTRVINPTEMEVKSTPKQKPVKRAQNPSRIDNLTPYNIADDILSKQSFATLG
ncbi:4393_t:CDS:2 [Funneliformis mosseae]|uniref:4393_t:CDS:1 n=1 Tax=Funneliformis mosseae TaxID=27381 RepID=A0A9N9EZH5_FUNMO|nr:4393_t:CDS:2 [Funneliformis mosseae]